ncbi:MAG TPA: hypothetical protein VF644_00975 [Pyrinomonadaceae bacterium]|jgi:hypothetical protein
MNNLKRKDKVVPVVPQAVLPDDLSFEKMSRLGRDLWQISKEIEQSGVIPLLDENEIEIELNRRRGGYVSDYS